MVFKQHKDDYQFGEDYDLAIPNEQDSDFVLKTKTKKTKRK